MQMLLRGNRVVYGEPFVSSRIGVREEITSQLKQYRYVDRISEAPHKRQRGLSGKDGGKNDDLSIACQMLSYFPQYYLDNPGGYARKLIEGGNVYTE